MEAGNLERGLPVDAANSLAVVTRVPAGIQDYHAIGTHQVDAKAAGLRRNLEIPTNKTHILFLRNWEKL